METGAELVLSFNLFSLSFSFSGWLKVFAVKPGIVGIYGVKSRLYLCMNKDGTAQGMVSYISLILLHQSTYVLKAIKNAFFQVSLGVGDICICFSYVQCC